MSGRKPMSSIRLASNIREGGRGSPLLLLNALNAPQSLSAIEDQKLGDQTLPAVVFTQGSVKYIIIFDRATRKVLGRLRNFTSACADAEHASLDQLHSILKLVHRRIEIVAQLLIGRRERLRQPIAEIAGRHER